MRLAPSASARSTISAILSMLARCTTAFTVRRSLCRTTSTASARAGIAGDVVGGLSVAVLDRYLYMVEPGLSQCAEPLLGDPDRGGDQIGVKAGGMGPDGNVHEIALHTRLAARQMHPHYTKLRRLAEDAHPSRHT